MKGFIDTNILLDVLLRRAPFFNESQKIWFLAERGKIQGLISTLSFSNIYYIVRKLAGPKRAESMLAMLRDCFSPVAFDEQVLNQAMDAGFSDFEDAIQYFSALRADADCLITRDPRHFPKSHLPVMSPADFLAAHSFK